MRGNINSRLTRIERELDYSCLRGEQLRRLDVRKLSRQQIQSLDVMQLSDEQIFAIGLDSLSDHQLEALSGNCSPEIEAIIETMTDDELRAAAEGRMCVWYRGYKGELTA
jgi:hypothetical protein